MDKSSIALQNIKEMKNNKEETYQEYKVNINRHNILEDADKKSVEILGGEEEALSMIKKNEMDQEREILKHNISKMLIKT